MIFNKIYRHFKDKKILDIKYIIVEITLIFIGITLAAKYNNYQNQLKDEAFLNEAIIQIHQELIKDKEENIVYYEAQKQKAKNISLIRKSFLEKNEIVLKSDSLKNIFIHLPNFISISNYNLGYSKLSNKNINLIENNELKNQIIRYYNNMSYLITDVSSFNKDIEALKPYFLKHFKNFRPFETFEEIIDIKNMTNDNQFLNSLNFVESDMLINMKSYEDYFIKHNTSLIQSLEKEYPFLKEENKK